MLTTAKGNHEKKKKKQKKKKKKKKKKEKKEIEKKTPPRGVPRTRGCVQGGGNSRKSLKITERTKTSWERSAAVTQDNTPLGTGVYTKTQTEEAWGHAQVGWENGETRLKVRRKPFLLSR